MLLYTRTLTFFLLCLITFAVPWEEMLVIPGFGTVIVILSSFALLFAFLSVIISKTIRKVPTIFLVLSLCVYWISLSVFWSVDYSATLVMVRTYISLLLLVWMMFEFTDTHNRFLWLLRSYVLGSVVTISLLFTSYIGVLEKSVDDGTRLTGGGLNQNDFALIVCIAIVVLAYLAVVDKTEYRGFYWILLIPSSLSILLTGSRTGAIALVVAIGFGALTSVFAYRQVDRGSASHFGRSSLVYSECGASGATHESDRGHRVPHFP